MCWSIALPDVVKETGRRFFDAQQVFAPTYEF